MENPPSDVDDSRAELPDFGPRNGSKIDRLPLWLCWGGLVLFVVSLLLPAIRVQGRGEWVAGDLGCVCLILSFYAFPCWVPHVLTIAAPFICTFAGKTAKKAVGVVLALATLSILQVCIPEVVRIGFLHGLLAGFWLWALALITTTAGLLIGGFSPGRTTSPWKRSVELPASHERSRRAILLCWAGLALLILWNISGGSIYLMSGAGARGGFRDLLVLAMLAMAPLVCTFAGGWTQRIMALALVAFALYPVDPSLMIAGVSAAGLLVSAGFPSRRARAGLENADLEGTKTKGGNTDSTFSGTRSGLGPSLCWVGLAAALGLGLLPFRFMSANEKVGTLIAVYIFNPYLGYSVLAMAPLVCTFCGPVARRIVGGLLALQAAVNLPMVMLFGLYALPDLIAFVLSAAGLLSLDVRPGKKASIPSRFGRFSETVTARLLGTMLVLLVAALALGAWLLQRKASARAESAINDRFAHEAISRVDQFVREEGRWPRSWSELAGGPMRVMYDSEKAEMRRRISIDFGVDPQDVARQDPMRFTAIRPTGPSVEYRTWGAVEALQRTIRESLRGSTRMRPPPASRANLQPTIRKSFRGSNEGSPGSPSTDRKKAGKRQKTGT